MNVEEAREFLRDHHRAILLTRRRDGGVQGSPVAATVDADGRAVVSTRETAMKAKNLARHPHATLVVIPDEWYGSFAQVEGPTEIVHLPDAMEPLVDYYRRVAGEHDDWDEFRDAMESERRVLLRMTIERAGPTTSG